jgi:hypothetical protein
MPSAIINLRHANKPQQHPADVARHHTLQQHSTCLLSSGLEIEPPRNIVFVTPALIAVRTEVAL